MPYPLNQSGAAAVLGDLEDVGGEVVVGEEPEEVRLVVAFHVAGEEELGMLVAEVEKHCVPRSGAKTWLYLAAVIMFLKLGRPPEQRKGPRRR